MKKLIFLTIFILFLFSCKVNNTIVDERTKKVELIGNCNRNAFEKEEFKKWFTSEYNSYEPDEKLIVKLKNNSNIENLKVVVIFGTWCHDSRRELPRFYKIVDKINFSESKIKLIGIDTEKSSQNKLLSNIEFKKIPTFIFYKKGKEIGRIIESTKISLEADILKILNKN